MENNYISEIIEGVSPAWLELFELGKQQGFDIAMDLLSETKRTVPDRKKILEAFRYFEPEETKVIIIGQDPYPSGSDGLAFSCKNKKPSVKRIFEVLKNQGFIDEIPATGCLKKWASQGVLLLNSSLTLESNPIIWKLFVENVLRKLDSPNRVLVMWGNKAKAFKTTDMKYMISTWCHPSPLCRPRTYKECYKTPTEGKTVDDINPKTDFLQCDTFKKISEFLGSESIKW